MSDSSENNFYDDVSNILMRISNKTNRMKTNNLILLNKVNHEVNTLLQKAQDIVKSCLNDRNEFLKEVESIQDDYGELNQAIEERREAVNRRSQQLNENNDSNQMMRQSNLNQLFDDSEDDDCENRVADQLNKEIQATFSKFNSQQRDFRLSKESDNFQFPETVMTNQLDLMSAPMRHPNVFRVDPKPKNSASGFTIRETIDQDEPFNFRDTNVNRNPPAAATSATTTTTGRKAESIFKTKARSNDSISSSTAKTPTKKGTPKKYNHGITPTKSSGNINNKKIDQFFKKVDTSPLVKCNNGGFVDERDENVPIIRIKQNPSQQQHASQERLKNVKHEYVAHFFFSFFHN